MVNIFTASNIKDRHELVSVAIPAGASEEEERAFWMATELSWIFPLVILGGGLIDILLIVVYMKVCHPWKDILSDEKNSTNIDSSKDGMDYLTLKYPCLYIFMLKKLGMQKEIVSNQSNCTISIG